MIHLSGCKKKISKFPLKKNFFSQKKKISLPKKKKKKKKEKNEQFDWLTLYHMTFRKSEQSHVILELKLSSPYNKQLLYGIIQIGQPFLDNKNIENS